MGHGVRFCVEFSTSARELRVRGFGGLGSGFALKGKGGEVKMMILFRSHAGLDLELG